MLGYYSLMFLLMRYLNKTFPEEYLEKLSQVPYLHDDLSLAKIQALGLNSHWYVHTSKFNSEFYGHSTILHDSYAKVSKLIYPCSNKNIIGFLNLAICSIKG